MKKSEGKQVEGIFGFGKKDKDKSKDKVNINIHNSLIRIFHKRRVYCQNVIFSPVLDTREKEIIDIEQLDIS